MLLNIAVQTITLPTYVRYQIVLGNLAKVLFKPFCVGIHWIAPSKYSQMSTNMPGFQSLFRFSALFSIGQISHQQHKG